MEELESIQEHIANNQSFVLSGGAGSGKTYTLVQVIRAVISKNQFKKVACITYTNAAAKEVENRVNHPNLHVSTIHDFLWDNIKHFQKELKVALVDLLNNPESGIKIQGIEEVSEDFFEGRIEYKDYLRLREGIISHDELIAVAEEMFKLHPRLSSIVKDKYPFIFIDEYQDTHSEVIRIFTVHFELDAKNCVVGYFGDSMQSIYANGVGDLNEYIESGKVSEVQKEQNRRNPQLVINLANKLRTDGLVQVASADETAPNVNEEGNIKSGDIKFLYSENQDLSIARDFIGWDFANSSTTKVLNLTHNLISGPAGFDTLMSIYNSDGIIGFKKKIKKFIKDNNIDEDFSEMSFGQVVDFLQAGKTGAELNRVSPTAGMRTFIDTHPELYEFASNLEYTSFESLYIDKDQLIDDKKLDSESEISKGSKRDTLINHLFKIQRNIDLYSLGKFNDFIRSTDYQGRLNSIEQRKALKEGIDQLVNVGDKSIEEIINQAHGLGICIKDDKIEQFIEDKVYLYHRVKAVRFSEFQNLYTYLEARTPFSTQHKTKGQEFDNVLVVLNNGNWNQYNFEYLFNPDKINQLTQARRNSFPRILERTKKIFYVCCTRAKENLAVFYSIPTEEVLATAKEWFGEENVINLDQ